ncbi:hypothetical protein ACTFIY_011982 [Dictyostelium cf. discoideum]
MYVEWITFKVPKTDIIERFQFKMDILKIEFEEKLKRFMEKIGVEFNEMKIIRNKKYRVNQVNSDERLVVANEDIKLDLAKLYGDSNEFQTFIIRKEDGFRRRKIGKNNTWHQW